MILPEGGTGERADPEMPEGVRAVYEEARTIAQKSPRAAAALLRQSVEMLCRELCEVPQGKQVKLNEMIKTLKEEGRVKGATVEALEMVRVVGNDAVHAGMIDLEEDGSLLEGLFGCVNKVVDDAIGEPKRQETLLQKIPEEERKKMKIK